MQQTISPRYPWSFEIWGDNFQQHFQALVDRSIHGLAFACWARHGLTSLCATTRSGRKASQSVQGRHMKVGHTIPWDNTGPLWGLFHKVCQAHKASSTKSVKPTIPSQHAYTPCSYNPSCRTGGDFWQTTACPEQPSQSRLPEPGSHRCQATASLTTLASSEATYKVALLTHKVQTTATVMYLSEPVQTHAPPQALHSSNAPLLVVPRIHTELARHAFSAAASSTWNSLPADIRLCKNILTLKHHPSVQTHLVLLCCIKHLCIFRPKCAKQIRYYYYYYYLLSCNYTVALHPHAIQTT